MVSFLFRVAALTVQDSIWHNPIHRLFKKTMQHKIWSFSYFLILIVFIKLTLHNIKNTLHSAKNQYFGPLAQALTSWHISCDSVKILVLDWLRHSKVEVFVSLYMLLINRRVYAWLENDRDWGGCENQWWKDYRVMKEYWNRDGV